MRRIFILLSFLLVPFSLLAQGWEWQSSTPQGSQIQEVLFIDVNTVCISATNDPGTSAWSEARSSTATSVHDRATIPTEFTLSQNSPRSFNPNTAIRGGSPDEARLRLEVFNMPGGSVAVLIDGEQVEDYRAGLFARSVLASGVYLWANELRKQRDIYC